MLILQLTSNIVNQKTKGFLVKLKTISMGKITTKTMACLWLMKSHNQKDLALTILPLKIIVKGIHWIFLKIDYHQILKRAKDLVNGLSLTKYKYLRFHC